MKNSDYIPALKYSWLTRFYDPVVALTTRESMFRQKLLKLADFKAGDRVLDLACGTGTFAAMVKARHPDVEMTGLDADPNILALARKKARNTGVDIAFDEGRSDDMPYATGEFEVAFSSLFFHHLQTPEKLCSMAEVLRVLRPGGVFHVCDWGRPSNLFSRVMFNSVRLLDGFDVTQDNVDGRLPFFLEEAGFCDIKVLCHVETMLGTLDLMAAQAPVDSRDSTYAVGTVDDAKNGTPIGK